jgi:hypothetical protein
MPSVTIDASVLAAPSVHSGPEGARRYVDTLLDWSVLLEEPWVAIYMSERSSESLDDDGVYPFREQLQRVFSENGITEFSVNDVSQVITRLLKLTPSFETFFRIRDVLTEDLATEPDVISLCSGDKLQSDLGRCIVLIAILRHHCNEPVVDHSLILPSAPRKIVQVRARIQILEHDRDDMSTPPTAPDYFQGDVLVCDDFRGLIDCLDEATLLLKATDNVGVETAIRVAVHKARMARGMVPEWDVVPDCRVGHAFLTSFNDRHPTAQLSAKVLRAIIETLEQTNMAATHPLRTGRGGGDPERVRTSDQAKAWRRDIDRDHHLHYWACEHGFVEIASVSFPHDDFAIPE